ncbi:LOW QUALITY PROTEIN: hypothetical protein CVT25_008447 [Psilocybe cyanescens]|uniref:CxC2-like cysteine cluster KDZ transposase-associated domain-containing protein n=1 Tax=Psilocybe cyanescens TaxID=93625 RepID=A0A409WV17_PSICY|nr:LOW QUALITY PROTEIN: hypothetical protein CVT25_008447 [Psilocybe cyanescens]
MAFSQKRQQVGSLRKAGTYHNPVPVFNDFNIICHSEGSIRNIGGSAQPTCIHLSPEHVAGAWEQVAFWSPPDDKNFALEPDEGWYNETLEAEVMEDLQPLPTAKPKKKKSVVAVSGVHMWYGRQHIAKNTSTKSYAGLAGGTFVKPITVPIAYLKHPAVQSTGAGICRGVPQDVGTSDTTQPHGRILREPNCIPFKHADPSYQQHTFRQPILLWMFTQNPPPSSTPSSTNLSGLPDVRANVCDFRASPSPPQTCLDHKRIDIRLLSVFRKVNNKSRNPPTQITILCVISNDPTWAGRGHDVTGVAGTTPGGLAVKCPSCPHPGINLPADWETVSKEMKFLYTMIICMDANFRLKNQLVSNYSQDPGLGIGLVYMVPREPYETYVFSRADDKDISTCVGFQALAKANTKFSVGLRYTGVGTVVCRRSEMVMPIGVGNLQKGERYANMDYLFALVLQMIAVHWVLVSYDIACQWFINLFKRIDANWPESLKPRPNISLVPAIPKLHEPMHTQANHQVYSLNYIPGVGLSDCECPERVLSNHNALSNATKTQGPEKILICLSLDPFGKRDRKQYGMIPGSQQDTLDNHFGYWNWLKYVLLGTSLLRRYKNAVAERNIQSEGHCGLSKSLDADVLKRWEDMCQEWDADGFLKKAKNPYHMEEHSLTEAQKAKQHILPKGIHFRIQPLLPWELEEVQRCIRRIAKGTGQLATIRQTGSLTEQRNVLSIRIRAWEQLLPIYIPAKGTGQLATIRQTGSLTEQRNVLSIRIRAWEQLLPIYIPGILQYQTDHPMLSSSTNSEDTILWLPSIIPEPHRSRICISGLAAIESRLRHAQMVDSLGSVRQILKVKMRMIQYKQKNIHGQRDGTRSTAVIDRVHERARFAAAKYHTAHIAQLALLGPGIWEMTFKKLEDGDIRGYQDPNQLHTRVGRRGTFENGQGPADGVREEEGDLELFNDIRTRRDGTGQTQRTLSWIWTATTSTNPEDDQDEILRVEWAKSRARALQAKEEVMLLKEEMRRTVAFLDWKANWWRNHQRSRAATESKALLEGISVYSLSQADVQDSLANHFCGLWKAPLQESISDAEQQIENNEDEEDDDDGDGDEEEIQADDFDDDA